MSVPGVITSLTTIGSSTNILVTYVSRGMHSWNVVGTHPSISVINRSTTPFPSGYGSQPEYPVSSNECEGFVVLQTHEASLHVITVANAVHPKVDVFHLTKQSPVLPVRSMVLVPRGSGHVGLLAVFGDDDFNTELRLFDLKAVDGKVHLERVVSLPPNLASVAKDGNPYRLYAGDNRVLFIGGDSARFSSVTVLSTAEVFSSSLAVQKNIHCQPFPRCQAVSCGTGFLIATGFGELYSIDASSMNVTLVCAVGTAPSGPSTISYFPESNGVFLGSRQGDSILVSIESGVQSVVVTNTAPVLALTGTAECRTITSVSGVGHSASVNRIKTSGVAVARLANETRVRGWERIFCVNTFVVVSSSVGSRVLSVDSDEGAVVLREHPSVALPAGIIGVYAYAGNGVVLCVADTGVFVWSGSSVKQTWKSPALVTACDYCAETGLLVMASGRRLYSLTKTGCTDSAIDGIGEISAVAVFASFTAIADWEGVVVVRDQETVCYAFHQRAGGSIGRSVWLGRIGADKTVRCSVGYSDGSFSAAALGDTKWIETNSNEQLGLLVPVFVACDLASAAVITAGDRPCVISVASPGGALVATELVDTDSGTVVPMRHVGGLLNLVWFLNELGEIDVCSVERTPGTQTHVQRRFLSGDASTLPVGVEVIDRTIAVAVSNLEISADEIQFFDIFTMAPASCLKLSPSDQLTCVTRYGAGLVVGTGHSGSASVEPAEGRILVLEQDAGGAWAEVAATTVLKTDGSAAGPVYAVTACGEYIVALAVRTVAILKRSAHNDLVHVVSIESDFMGVSVASAETPTGFQILVGDINRSCSLFSFDKDENTLTRTARDVVPASCLSVEILGSVFLMGDELGNVYALRLVEPSLGRLERIEGCNIGNSAVVSIRRVDDSSCWVGCRDGSVCLLTLGPGGRKIASNKSVLVDDVFEPTRVSFPSVAHRMVISE